MKLEILQHNHDQDTILANDRNAREMKYKKIGIANDKSRV